MGKKSKIELSVKECPDCGEPVEAQAYLENTEGWWLFEGCSAGCGWVGGDISWPFHPGASKSVEDIEEAGFVVA